MNMAIIHAIAVWFELDTPVLERMSHSIQKMKILVVLPGRSLPLQSRGAGLRQRRQAAVPRDRSLLAGSREPVYEWGAAFLANMSAIDLTFNVRRAGEIVRVFGRITSKEAVVLRSDAGTGVTT